MAAFGYSVGDFIAVVQLAYKARPLRAIYDGCKTSVEEYKDIGRDVGNTHIVLSAIQRYWKEEESRGRTLVVAQQEDLKQLADNSEGILQKIQGVLDKHRSLGDRGGLGDKLKWSLTSFVRDIGPQRTALQGNTNALAIFNATLTAENASGVADQQIKMLEAQGQLLKFLVTRYVEYQTGTGDRVAPAFSQVAVKDIKEDEDNSWENIDAEFEVAGFNPTVIKRNRGFIRDWITTVMPEDGDKDTAGAGSTVVGGDDDAPEPPNIDGLSMAAPQMGLTATQQRTENAQQIQEPIENRDPASEIPRPVSASSHRSQTSTWRDPSADGTALAVDMISKVLRSKYGDDNDNLYMLPIKRAYYALDWTDRGWISREEAQHCCKEAVIKAGFYLRTTAIVRLVGLMDKNQDHEINCGELIEAVMELRQEVLKRVTRDSLLAGRIDCGLKLKSALDGGHSDHLIPTGWSAKLGWKDDTDWKRVYVNSLVGQPQYIAPLHRNFANAAFIATTYCAPQIAKALSNWRRSLLEMPIEQSKEYTIALDGVYKATARIHLFESATGQRTLNDLDQFIAQVHIIPLEFYEDLKDCPDSQLETLRTQCWKLLDPILGFVYDLKAASSKSWLSGPSKVSFRIAASPPSLGEWRRLRMLERSKVVTAILAEWKDTKELIQACRDWYTIHSADFEAKANQVIANANALQEKQEKFATATGKRSINIEEVKVDKFVRDIFRVSPSTQFCVIVDKRKVGFSHISPKDTSPVWWYNEASEVTPDSKIRLEFYDVKKWDTDTIGETAVGFLGSYDFNVRDVTKFEDYSKKVTTSGKLQRPSRFGLPNAKVSVTVSSTWVSDNVKETSKGSLSPMILGRPIPGGWEPRWSKANDVYFVKPSYARELELPTACLWTDPLRNEYSSPSLMPLPRAWKQIVDRQKLIFIDDKGQRSENRPPIDATSTFMEVLHCKEFVQPLAFFPQSFVSYFETEPAGKQHMLDIVKTKD